MDKWLDDFIDFEIFKMEWEEALKKPIKIIPFVPRDEPLIWQPIYSKREEDEIS